MTKPFAGPSFLATFGLVLLAIAALFVADTFLEKTERAESLVEAARLFTQGRTLMNSGQNAAAIERLKDAIAIERGNRDYLRILAQAQLAAGKTADAESTLNELLQTDSTDSLSNLLLGRVLVNEGRFEEGIVYFRRAIYGQWKEDPAGNRRRVRFELIDLLAQRDSKEELLAELLPMQDQATQDSRTRTRLGRLFLQAGSPARAADVFREILHDTPGDAGAHAGLGEAEFDRGDYRAAQRDFHAALRLAPGDQATRQRLDLCDDLLTLDPMLRGLSPRERFWRSTRLLDLSREEASRCVGGNPSLELQELLDKAEKARKSRVSVARQSEALESNLDLAEQLWQAAKKQCKPAPAGDSPLTLVLARLAQ